MAFTTLFYFYAVLQFANSSPVPDIIYSDSRSPISAVHIDIEDGRPKYSLPLDLTYQGNEPINANRLRIPYTRYSGLSTLEVEPVRFIGPQLPSSIEPQAKDHESAFQTTQDMEDTTQPGSARKSPPIDNGGRHAKEGDFRNNEQDDGKSRKKRGAMSSVDLEGEALRDAEMREYVERGLGHVLEQRRWLLEKGE